MISPLLYAARPSERHRHLIIDERDSGWKLLPMTRATGSTTTTGLPLLAPVPLVVNVDVTSGTDAPSCIPSPLTSSTPTSSCKTIQYALKHGQIAARNTSSPLELAVAPGEYLGECPEEGNIVTMAITLKKKAGGGEVLIDCKGGGSLLNITQAASATSRLEGLTIANGLSKRGGGAASVGGGGLVLKDCVFRELTSHASSADGDFVGGGAVSFVVSAAFLKRQPSVQYRSTMAARLCALTLAHV
jgi:hypothetical protein